MVQRRQEGPRSVLYCALLLLLLLSGCLCGEARPSHPGLGRKGLLHDGLFASDSAVSAGHSRRGLRQAGTRLFADDSGVSAGESVVVTTGSELVAGLVNGSVTTLLLQGVVRLNAGDLQQAGGTIVLQGGRVVNITSEHPNMPATLDFGGIVNVMHIGAGCAVSFEDLTARGFASPYAPAAEQLQDMVVGQAVWPTFTSDPGAMFAGLDVTVYTLQADCSKFSTTAYARVRAALGPTNVQLLSPGSLFVKGTHTVTLPVVDIATNKTTGAIESTFRNALSICVTDQLAPGNAGFEASSSSGGGQAWWVWLLVGLGAATLLVAALTFAACFVLRRRRRQQTVQQRLPSDAMAPDPTKVSAAESFESAVEDDPPAGKPLSEPLGMQPSADSALATRSASSMLRTVSSTPSSNGSSSVAEASLLEAWRNRQLSMDSAADEVELGPMIGRGGYGRVHKARWRGALVAVKIVNHTQDGQQIKDIRVVRETLFSTSLLHPNIVTTFKIITIASPGGDTLQRSSSSTGGSRATSRGSGLHNSDTGDSGLSRRAKAFATAASGASSAAAAASGSAASQRDAAAAGSEPAAAGGAAGVSAAAESGSASQAAPAPLDEPFDPRRALSVRVDAEAELDEEEILAHGLEALSETWMLMEFCDRGSLERAVHGGLFQNRSDGRPDGTINMVKVYRCLLDIASGLTFLHSKSILHGDLKLGNILLKSTATDLRGFTCKICDFGMSRLMDASATHVSTSSMGTVNCMSPELLCGKGMSPAADVYSFGVIMYELYTGQMAFQGANLGHLIFQIVHDHQRPQVPDHCPEAYRELMTACWQHEPGKRPKCAEVLAQLQQQYTDYRAKAPPPTASTRTRSRSHVSYTYETLEIATPQLDGSGPLGEQQRPGGGA